MSSPYRLPSSEHKLTGACAFEGGLCAWSGEAAYRWAPASGWSALSAAPTAIDSGFELQSGVLAGADTHVGFLPSGADDWAGWVDLATFSDAHPLYGDLLLCIDAGTEAYALFGVTESGLDPISSFDADELADPVAGWSAPTTPERLLLLGDGGLWALSPPYTDDDLQHLVSFDAVDLPAFEDIPGPFQPGRATVIVPRRSRTGLRLDLSDGTGHATGLAHLPGGTALWRAYLADDRDTAARLLGALAALPAPSGGEQLQLHDMLMADGTPQALATSAGLYVPSAEADVSGGTTAELLEAPLDGARLATWALWLGWEGAREAACNRLCVAAEPSAALVESLSVFAGAEAIDTLFALFRADAPPTGSDGKYSVPTGALRALAASVGEAAASRVASGLSSAAVPARVAACILAGATRADALEADADHEDAAAAPALWTDDHPVPEDALLANTTHEHPAVRRAAHDTCARLSVEVPPSAPSS
jgi:hypothetical protein